MGLDPEADTEARAQFLPSSYSSSSYSSIPSPSVSAVNVAPGSWEGTSLYTWRSA